MFSTFLSFLQKTARTIANVAATIALGCTAIGATSAQAQAPFTTDVLPAGRTQIRIDAQSHVAPKSEGGWVWTLPSVSTGLGYGFDVGVGLSQVAPRTPGSAETDITLTAKWAPLAGRKSPVQLSVGTFAFLPTQKERDGIKVPTMIFNYVAASGAVIPSLGDASPQLTLAAFTVNGPRVGPFSDRRGVMVNIDQALPLSLARATGSDVWLLKANWVSNKTAFSYSSASLIAVYGGVNISLGYAVGNPSQYNHGPSVGLGWQF